ncbi:MAG: hypothetical protein HOW97_05825 [Catenulispora sp.]|nr:hypothetical protein [Catenulispora sp.]NUR60042.1 hypothetical protein [Catenulispora sp.]
MIATRRPWAFHPRVVYLKARSRVIGALFSLSLGAVLAFRVTAELAAISLILLVGTKTAADRAGRTR